jgi:hypothetical protein
MLCTLGLIGSAQAGLDVTAYEGLEIVKAPRFYQDGEPLGPQQVKLEPGEDEFAARFAGLQAGKVYHYRNAFEFSAGSYSGYNRWRNELARLAGYPASASTSVKGVSEQRYDATAWKLKKGPFWELINFSDAEGVIGPQACKRIYADFIQYQPAIRGHADADFLASYNDWFKAFKLCANGGALAFH